MGEINRLLCIVSAMNTGGAETFLMKIYRKLDKTKYQMDFCVNENKKGFYDDEIESLGGKIYTIPCKSNGLKKFRQELFNVIKNNNYKYVMRIASNGMGFYDLKIAKQAGAKCCIVRSSNSSDGNGVKTLLAHRIGRLLFSQYIDVKIAPSDLAAIYTFGKRNYEKGNVAIIKNAIDLNYYCFSENARLEIRKEFNISEKTFVIGHIGRFSTQKNHKYLIDIFSKIHETEKESVLFLVGTGELLEEIKRQVHNKSLDDCVIFAGIRSDIPRVLSAMDVFLFPSLYEGMPNTVIEAQAIGLPCVVSDTITREANITGLVQYVPFPGTIDDWTSKVINTRNLKRKYTHEEIIDAGYDIENQVQQFTSLVFKER